jgi:L-ascorbate metabolism protein UlaG (beta-lactamase superfamily)
MKPQHMNPAESVQALRDLEAARMLAMHWGTFDLSDEPLDEGPRALEQALLAADLTPERALVLPHGGSLPLATSRKLA